MQTEINFNDHDQIENNQPSQNGDDYYFNFTPFQPEQENNNSMQLDSVPNMNDMDDFNYNYMDNYNYNDNASMTTDMFYNI